MIDAASLAELFGVELGKVFFEGAGESPIRGFLAVAKRNRVVRHGGDDGGDFDEVFSGHIERVRFFACDCKGYLDLSLDQAFLIS